MFGKKLFEVKKIVDQTYKKAKDLIDKNKDSLERIANALLKYETLDADEVEMILQGGELDKPTVTDLLSAEQAKIEENEKPNNKKSKT